MANHAKVTESELRRLYRPGVSFADLAHKLGMNHESVRERLIRMGLHEPGPPRPRSLPMPQRVEVARMYAEGVLSSKIAKEFQISITTVRKIAREQGCEVNPRGQQYRRFTEDEQRTMRAMWKDGHSQTAIGIKLGTMPLTISRALREQGVATKKRIWGAKHPRFNGGRIKNQGGYWLSLVDNEHRFAVMRNRMGYILEHRLRMAEKLGRPLEKCETVHHKNGDHTDNRIENLQLRQGAHGSGVVLKCGDCGSHNVVHDDI